MEDFKGGSAAVQSIRFAGDHFTAFLKLTATWAAISTAIVLAFCFIAHPAGPDASLGAQLDALDAMKGRVKQAVTLLPDIFGTIAVGVSWIKFVLLDEEPRNPLRLTGEMGTYFVRSIQIGFLSALAALPGIIVAIALGSALGKPWGYVGAAIGGLAAVACFLVVYARLLIVLPSVAVSEDIKVGDAFGLTKQRYVAVTLGLFLSYLIPFVGLIALIFVLGMLSTLSHDIGSLLMEAGTNLGTFMMTGIVAGYTALVYRAFAPGDIGNQIAKQFE